MNAAPLLLKIMDVPGGRVIAQAKRKGSFEVWRAFVSRDELLEWLSNEIGCTAPSPGGDADAPDAGAVGSLPSRPEPGEIRMIDNADLQPVGEPVWMGVDLGAGDDLQTAEEPPAAPPTPVAVKVVRSVKEDRVAQLLKHVREIGGDRQMVRVSFAMLKHALGVSEPVISQAIKRAVAEGLLVKERRQGVVSVENWFGLPGAEAPALREDFKQAVVQQEGGEATGKAEPDGSPAPSGMPAAPARMSPAELDAASERVSQRVAAREAKAAVAVDGERPEIVPGCGLVLQSLRKIAAKNGSVFQMPLGRLATNSGVDPRRIETILAVLSKQGLIEHTRPTKAGGDHIFTMTAKK